MSLDVEHAVESTLGDVDLDLHSVRQTADDHLGSWEVRPELRCAVCNGEIAFRKIPWVLKHNNRLTAKDFRISRVARDALADGSVVGGVAEGVNATPLDAARILTSITLLFAVSVVCAVRVHDALGRRRLVGLDAVAASVQHVAKLNGADAIAPLVDDHSSFQIAHAASSLVHLHALNGRTVDAVAVVVQAGARWADAGARLVAHKALFNVASWY